MAVTARGCCLPISPHMTIAFAAAAASRTSFSADPLAMMGGGSNCSGGGCGDSIVSGSSGFRAAKYSRASAWNRPCTRTPEFAHCAHITMESAVCKVLLSAKNLLRMCMNQVYKMFDGVSRGLTTHPPGQAEEACMKP